jgi:O-antigen ligase
LAYITYVLIVPLGIFTAIGPGIVVFRFIELTVMLLVVGTTYGRLGATRLTKHVLMFIGVMTASSVIGAVASPDAGLDEIDGVLPFRLQGAFPVIAPNTLGFFGVVFFAFGLSRRKPLMTTVGVLIVSATQYRTGLAAMVAVLIVWLVCRRGLSGRLALLPLLAAGAFLISTPEFQDSWRLGQHENSVERLNGRMTFWEAGIDAAKRSPVIGTGLSSGTRFEVFQTRIEREETSNIHSVWVEAYVGTGVLGLSALGASFALAIFSAWRVWRAGGDLWPLLLLTAFSVRSATGTAFEIPGMQAILFLSAILLLSDPQRPPGGARYLGQDHPHRDRAIAKQSGDFEAVSVERITL